MLNSSFPLNTISLRFFTGIRKLPTHFKGCQII
jgi:hypothetical protein